MGKTCNPGCKCCGGGCQICGTVTLCDISPLASAVVTAKDAGGAAAGTATSASDGSFCINVTGTSPWTLTGTLAGYVFSIASASCGDTIIIDADTTTAKKTILVRGCANWPLPGATVVINGGTYTTDSTGKVILALKAGTYTGTVTSPTARLLGRSFTATVVCGSAQTFTPLPLSPSTGYVCCDFDGQYNGPIPTTKILHGTDSGGAFTVDWDQPKTFTGWSGCHLAPYPYVSAHATTDSCVPYGCQVPPYDMTAENSAAVYTISCSGGGGTVNPVNMGGTPYTGYYTLCTGTCVSGDHRKAVWVRYTTCAEVEAFSISPGGLSSTAFVLLSPPPATILQITYTSGGGWDVPIASPYPTGEPPSTVVVFTE